MENQENPQKLISPDFLLWNLEKELALIVEIKGGNSIEEGDITQTNKYKQISNEKIETYIKNVTEQKDVRIRDTNTCIVYKTNTIERCKRSASCIERLEKLCEKNLVLIQNHGDSLKSFNPEVFDFDKKLIVALTEGFELPLNPKTEFYMTDNACIKGLIWGISNYIFDNFFEGEPVREGSISPNNLKNDIFRYSTASLNDFSVALEFLLKYKFCKRGIRYQYIFQKSFLKQFTQLREILTNYDCNSKIKLQNTLEKFY